MLVEGQLLGAVEGQVVIVLLLIEIFLELVIGVLLLFVPVAEFGLGGEAVGHVVVVH